MFDGQLRRDFFEKPLHLCYNKEELCFVQWRIEEKNKTAKGRTDQIVFGFNRPHHRSVDSPFVGGSSCIISCNMLEKNVGGLLYLRMSRLPPLFEYSLTAI